MIAALIGLALMAVLTLTTPNKSSTSEQSPTDRAVNIPKVDFEPTPTAHTTAEVDTDPRKLEAPDTPVDDVADDHSVSPSPTTPTTDDVEHLARARMLEAQAPYQAAVDRGEYLKLGNAWHNMVTHEYPLSDDEAAQAIAEIESALARHENMKLPRDRYTISCGQYQCVVDVNLPTKEARRFFEAWADQNRNDPLWPIAGYRQGFMLSRIADEYSRAYFLRQEIPDAVQCPVNLWACQRMLLDEMAADQPN
ncbi:MAG: hypothetical protein AAF290_10675 [Pseudomonadota bacterium]